MKLIDADALRQAIYHEAFETDTNEQKWDSGCWIRFKMVERNIKEATAIEAEPVRHGHWIEYPDCLAYDGAFSDDHIVCSVCESVWSVLDNCTERFDYCPHCGAKLDEVSE